MNDDELQTVILVANDGEDIKYTNYWETKHALAGYFHVSCNAGVIRLLVPRKCERWIAEMRTGRSVSIEESLHMPGSCWDIVFEDGTQSPFSIAVDKGLVDRSMRPGKCTLTVWTENGKVLDFSCLVRTR